MASTAEQKRPFGIRDKISYAAGDLGCNMSFALKTYTLVFWTQFMGMTTELYGILLIVVQIWDAINDPLIGGIIDADRRKYRLGKFKTYVLFGSVGLLVAGALFFVPIPQAPIWAKILIYIAGYVLWDAFYTIANVPYGSMLSLITEDPTERAQLSTWRSLGSVVGSMLTMAIIPMIIFDSNDNIRGVPVFITALVMGVLGFISFRFMIRNTTIRVDENTVRCNENRRFNVFSALQNFCKNRAAIGATVAAMAMFIGMQGVASATLVLFQSYFHNAELSGIVQLLSSFPMLLVMPFIRKLVVKWGKKEASSIGAIISIVGGVMLFVLPVTPDNRGIAFYILSLIVYNLGLGIYTCVSWSLMADAIDYNEWKNGVREEGTVYSLHSFFRKLAQGLGPALIAFLMIPLGYDESMKGQQTMQVATNMRWLVSGAFLFSAVLMFLGVAVIYNLNAKKLKKMNDELVKRRAEANDKLLDTAETLDETLRPSTKDPEENE